MSHMPRSTVSRIKFIPDLYTDSAAGRTALSRTLLRRCPDTERRDFFRAAQQAPVAGGLRRSCSFTLARRLLCVLPWVWAKKAEKSV